MATEIQRSEGIERNFAIETEVISSDGGYFLAVLVYCL